MNMLDTFVKPMHPEGRKFVAIAAGITFVAFMIWDPLGWICAGLLSGHTTSSATPNAPCLMRAV